MYLKYNEAIRQLSLLSNIAVLNIKYVQCQKIV